MVTLIFVKRAFTTYNTRYFYWQCELLFVRWKFRHVYYSTEKIFGGSTFGEILKYCFDEIYCKFSQKEIFFFFHFKVLVLHLAHVIIPKSDYKFDFVISNKLRRPLGLISDTTFLTEKLKVFTGNNRFDIDEWKWNEKFRWYRVSPPFPVNWKLTMIYRDILWHSSAARMSEGTNGRRENTCLPHTSIPRT